MPDKRKPETLIGQTIGRLRVIGLAVHHNRTQKYMHCICRCGRSVITAACSLKNGSTRSCGCLKRQLARRRFANNLKGLRFGRLIVLCAKRRRRYGKGYIRPWLCRCDCGQMKIVGEPLLLRGFTKSCGCLSAELARARGKAGLTSAKNVESVCPGCTARQLIRYYRTNRPQFCLACQIRLSHRGLTGKADRYSPAELHIVALLVSGICTSAKQKQLLRACKLGGIKVNAR